MVDEYFDIHGHWWPEDLPANPAIVNEVLSEVGFELVKTHGDDGYYVVKHHG